MKKKINYTISSKLLNICVFLDTLYRHNWICGKKFGMNYRCESVCAYERQIFGERKPYKT